MDVEFNDAIKNLPQDIITILKTAPEEIKKNAKEIKFRLGRKIAITSFIKTHFLNKILLKEEIEEIFKSICGYSIHSHAEEIKKGFITLKGGHRAGICGTAVYENNILKNIKDISSINLRIARQVLNASETILKNLKENIGNLLIVGPPASGKTTILKDIAKNLTNKSVAIIDTRGEIAASFYGNPQNDVGNADVFDFFNREDGIIFAIRTMNPEYIICDEIGDENDINAIKMCVGTGVKLIATAHGENIKELKKRKIIEKILKTNAFSNIAILEGKKNPCKINSIVKVGEIF